MIQSGIEDYLLSFAKSLDIPGLVERLPAINGVALGRYQRNALPYAVTTRQNFRPSDRSEHTTSSVWKSPPVVSILV